MNHLIKTEWLKIKHYRAFWWMTGIVALTYPGMNALFYQIYDQVINSKDEKGRILKMLVGNPFTFPEVWHTVAYASSIFVFIPSIVIIMFITNEYTYKTHRQNIIDGWSRDQFMTSKLIDVLIISILATIVYFIAALIIGYVNFEDGSEDIWKGSKYIGLFFLQTFSQLSIAFLIAFMARKAFISLGIFLFYKMILEKILVALAIWKLDDIGRFLPFEISNRLIPVPAFLGRLREEEYKHSLAAINEHIVYSVLVLALTWFISFKLNRKRDL